MTGLRFGYSVSLAAVAMAAAMLAPALCPAQPSFTEAIVDSAFGGPAGLYVSDVDGDGRNDILGAAVDSADIAWWRNDGADPVGWSKQTVASSFGGAIFVYAEDVDGDMDTDILGAGWNRAQIAWWSNGGQDSIVWTKQVIANGYTRAHEVYACDLDRDGDIDVMGASAGLNEITWWRNDGGSPITWTEQVIDSACPGARSVRAGDLDGDGDMDAVSAALESNEVSWYRNEGGDPIVWTEFVITSSFGMSHMVRIADMDGDNDPDIVGTGYTVDQIAYWENQGGDPVVWVKHVVASAFDGAVTGYPADIDSDGDIDVLGAADLAGDIVWWENLGGAPATWRRHDIDLDLAGAWPACADDINGDGCVDLVAGGDDANTVKWWRNDCLAGVTGADDDTPEMRKARLFRNHPNPFGASTVISFEVERASHARLTVYDTMGRRVRTLFDGVAAGVNRVEWDGRDESGEAVSAGVYFARIVAGGFSHTRSMTLLR